MKQRSQRKVWLRLRERFSVVSTLDPPSGRRSKGKWTDMNWLDNRFPKMVEERIMIDRECNSLQLFEHDGSETVMPSRMAVVAFALYPLMSKRKSEVIDQ